MIEINKSQYLVINGYVKIDKEIDHFGNEFTYCRLMRNGHKMMYSDDYINNHSIEQLQKLQCDF